MNLSVPDAPQVLRQVDEDVRMQEIEASGGVLLNTKHE